MYKAIVFLLFLLVIEVAVVWRPFDSSLIAYNSGHRRPKVAGQIVEGFHLTQAVPAGLFHAHLPRRSITHWHKVGARLYTGQPNCFAIQFATYKRRNSGHVLVSWMQGTNSQRWQLDVADLRDNAFVAFCPSVGIDLSAPFRFSVDGVDSVGGQAATLWLAKTRLDPAIVNGKSIGGRSIVFRLTQRHQVGPMQIAGLDRGAFTFACLCSLGIGVLVLVGIQRKRRSRPN